MRYGLIGERLSHSYSAPLHQILGSWPYELCPLDKEAFLRFMEARAFEGVNVTIPYKQQVIPFCDALDETAREVGAVNTLVNRGGKLLGYNTDAAGLRMLVQQVLPKPEGKTALVLGSGGTSHTARYVLQKLGLARVLVASRRPGPGAVSYDEALQRTDVQLLVNTTPVGMFPGNGQCPLSLEAFPRLEAVADAIYNPARTALVLAAQRRGLPAAGGLLMLAEQARISSGLFTGQAPPEEMTTRLIAQLQTQLYNIVLIGMPGCGKSSLGRQLARRTGREFVDLDAVVARQQGRSPEEIIEQEGEAAFRLLETEAAREVGKQNRQVIATGGGAVLREENLDALRQNGTILWIDCPPERLSTNKHRPLSKTPEDLKRLDAQRRPLYERAADGTIQYHPDFKKNLARLLAAAHAQLEQPLF